MRVTITDALGEALAAQRTTQDLDREVEQRLRETLHAPRSRVVLSLDQLEEIAQQIGTGLPIRNKGDLDRALSQVAQVRLGNLRLQWTPSQLREIEAKAEKHGLTTAEFIAQVASKILMDVFNVPPGSQGVFYTPGFDPDDSVEDEEQPETVDGIPEH